MRVAGILRHKGSDVVTIEAHKSVYDAICKLNQHGIGALIVTGAGGGHLLTLCVATANLRTISVAGSTARIPATLWPACQKSRLPLSSREARLICQPDLRA